MNGFTTDCLFLLKAEKEPGKLSSPLSCGEAVCEMQKKKDT